MGCMSIAGRTVDTDCMSEAGEDFWQRRFREADERAALLAEATVPELVEIYLVSGRDFELGSMCFQALQRRPHSELLTAALSERRAKKVARRDFAASLLSLATRTAEERAANLPVLMGMLKDRSTRVVTAALEAMHLIQTSASGHAFGVRLRAGLADVPPQGWPPMPTVLDLDELAALAGHRSARVRESLGRAMWLCGDARAVAILLRLTHDEDEFVRGQGAYALGELKIAGGPLSGVVERLWEMADGDTSNARFDALASLVDLGDTRAEARVEPELRAALDAGLHHGARYQLVHLLWKRPNLVSEPLRARLESQWKVNFGAHVPSQFTLED